MAEWVAQAKMQQILILFSSPKTPRQVEKALGIKKLKMKPLLDKKLVKILNPEARKGRLYIITNKSRGLLNLSDVKRERGKDWDLLGWLLASPRQRLVVLKVMDGLKRTSEQIRERASKFNSHLSRISTKGILRELVKKNLVLNKMIEGKRYYWISGEGWVLVGLI